MWKSNALAAGNELTTPRGDVYRIVRFLARGGFSEVYEAVQVASGQTFAIKVLQLRRTDSKAVERTRREGDLLRAIRHPNVVQVFDYAVREDGLIWMVMELLTGRTLRNLMDQTKPRVPVPWALRIAADIASALGALHRYAIHRDLKPQNIQVGEDGQARVFDLGAGRVFNMALVTTDPKLTMGSLLYMSPEQLLEPDNIDPRSDLFAVGIILFEMLAGRHPFSEQDGEFPGWGLIGHTIVTSPHADLKKAAPHVPAYVLAIVERLLQKDPDRRYQSASEAQQALAHAIELYERAHPTVALADVANTFAPEVFQDDDDHVFTSGFRSRVPKNPRNAFADTTDPLVPYVQTEPQQTLVPSPTPSAATPNPPVAPSPAPAVEAIAKPALRKTQPMPIVTPSPSPAEVAPPPSAPPEATGLLSELLYGDTRDAEAFEAVELIEEAFARGGPDATQAISFAFYHEHPHVRVDLALRFVDMGIAEGILLLDPLLAREKDPRARFHLEACVLLLTQIAGAENIARVRAARRARRASASNDTPPNASPPPSATAAAKPEPVRAPTVVPSQTIQASTRRVAAPPRPSLFARAEPLLLAIAIGVLVAGFLLVLALRLGYLPGLAERLWGHP